MNKVFTSIAILYVACAFVAGAGALTVTIWAYNGDGRMLSDTVTATVINTAAAVAAMGFFGGFDMIFTIWQFMRNLEAEKARDQEREQERETRQQEREAREQEREAREQEREECEQERVARQREREQERAAMRAEHEEIIALMRAERERTDAMTALITEFREELTHRRNNSNGSGSAGNAEQV